MAEPLDPKKLLHRIAYWTPRRCKPVPTVTVNSSSAEPVLTRLLSKRLLRPIHLQ